MIELNIENLDEVLEKFGPKLYARAMRQLMTKAAQVGDAQAKRHAPVVMGGLRERLTHIVDPGAIPKRAQVGTNMKHAPFMEFGTGLLADGPGGKRKRHRPPAGALDRWAYLHGMGQGAGFLVARAIYRRGGLEPRRFLRDARDDVARVLPRLRQKAMQDIAREWSKA
jgi:hypothetical protein